MTAVTYKYYYHLNINVFLIRGEHSDLQQDIKANWKYYIYS
jgi:hypothetical protein